MSDRWPFADLHREPVPEPQAALFWQGRGLGAGTSPFSDGWLYCPACGIGIGRFRAIFSDTRFGIGENVSIGGEPTMRTATVMIGARVTLGERYVIAQTRHRSGVKRWYRRQPPPSSRPGPEVSKFPVVATCDCGQDILINGTDPRAKRYATASEDERAEMAWDDFIDDAMASISNDEIAEVLKAEPDAD